MVQTNSDSGGTKICSAISKYALDTLNDGLRNRHSNGESLRNLATFVNQQILEATITRVNASMITDPESLYRILTDDEVSMGRRAEIETTLEKEGINIKELKKDFVSHQTVKHHLNQELGVDTSRENSLTVSDAISRIDWSQSRNEAVIRNTLSQLEALNELETGGYTLSTSARVSCNECGKTYYIHEFLDNSGCSCQITPEQSTKKLTYTTKSNE